MVEACLQGRSRYAEVIIIFGTMVATRPPSTPYPALPIDNSYILAEASLAFPFLPISEVGYFIEQSRTLGQRSAVRLFRQRIREILDSQN